MGLLSFQALCDRRLLAARFMQNEWMEKTQRRPSRGTEHQKQTEKPHPPAPLGTGGGGVTPPFWAPCGLLPLPGASPLPPGNHGTHHVRPHSDCWLGPRCRNGNKTEAVLTEFAKCFPALKETLERGSRCKMEIEVSLPGRHTWIKQDRLF
ncbi:unnamed protein product [Nyctereutes procyonoides]|uniref:(raccoon dog) hypothetical protein n=1 Tax=Nyctereutes procyonoides TaxID=34880 RepID=A0A811ZCR9_NYCPR|nr:unnamed protein product [Nyctereutes procyonoides]